MSKLIAKEVNEGSLPQSKIKAIAKDAYENLIYDVQVVVMDESNDEKEQELYMSLVFQEIENMMGDRKWKVFRGLKRN
jgi:hypothetical protein